MRTQAVDPAGGAGGAGGTEWASPRGELEVARARGMERILGILAAMSLGTLLVLCPWLLAHHLWLPLLSNLAAVAALTVLWRVPGWSTKRRAIGACLLSLGTAGLSQLVPALASVALANLFTAVVVATTMLGVRVGIGVASLAVLSYAVQAAGIHSEALTRWVAGNAPRELVAMVGFVGVLPQLAVAVVALSPVLEQLAASAAEHRRRSRELADEIARREAAQLEALQSTARARALLEVIPDAVVYLDLARARVLDANPAFCRLFGMAHDEVVGQRAAAFGIDRAAPPLSDAVARLRESGALTAIELEARTRDGRPLKLEASASLLRGFGSDVVAAIVRDVTEHRAVAARLRRRQHAESIATMVSGVSHFYNNAFAAILPNIDYVLGEVGEDLKEPLRDAKEATERAVALSRQLMVAARGPRGDVRERVAMGPLVESTIAMCRSGFGSTVDIVASVATPLGTVRAQEADLRQLLMSLLFNAREASESVDGPRVTVRVETRMGPVPETHEGPLHCHLVVEDNGVGMPEEVQRRLGEPFFTTKSLATHTGLGLATAYGIARELGGAITFASEPGRGTRFVVDLPSEPAMGAAILPAALPGGAPRRSGRTVLAIDDEAMVLRATRRMLGVFGFEVVCVESGAEGLRLLRESPGRFACVLLDLNMPEMSGARVLKEIRATQPALPVVIMTGNLDQAILPGAQAQLSKPVDGEELARTLAGLMERPEGEPLH